MAVTGDGSESNPWVVSTLDEFIDYANRGNPSSPHLYITVPSNTVWDMDEYSGSPYYRQTTIIGRNVTVNGNGLVIKNIMFENKDTRKHWYLLNMRDTIVKDTHFINVQIMGNGYYAHFAYNDSASFYSEFQGCCITGSKYDGGEFFDSYGNSAYYKFTNCLVRVKCTGYARLYIGYATYFENSLIDVDTEISDAFTYVGTLKNSILQGNWGVKNLIDTIQIYIDYTQPNAINIGLDETCKLQIRTKETGTFKSIINTDKIKATIFHSENDIELTDSQFKDTSYLSNIGVPYYGQYWTLYSSYYYPYGYLTQPQIKYLIRDYYKPLGAFANNSNLTKVQIPKSVKFIGRETFANTGLTEVTIASDCVYFSDSFPQGCNIKFYED